VPLSDHEQRLLDQIERALYADDPKFADTVRTTDLRSHYRRRLLRSVIALVVGLAVMLAGVIAAHGMAVIYVAVGGFVIMLLAAYRGAVALGRVSGRTVGGWGARARPRPAQESKPRVRIRDRFEERWRRRFEDRGES
jgi:hypothetical protein